MIENFTKRTSKNTHDAEVQDKQGIREIGFGQTVAHRDDIW